jgi:hypothetical protein
MKNNFKAIFQYYTSNFGNEKCLDEMNCDGSINIIDVSMLNISFGMVGGGSCTP